MSKSPAAGFWFGGRRWMADLPGFALVITATFSGVSTLVTALVGGLILYKQSQNRLALTNVVTDVAEVKGNVATIEKATNSMKDALVASTAKASHAEGMKDQRDQTESGAALPAAKDKVAVIQAEKAIVIQGDGTPAEDIAKKS